MNGRFLVPGDLRPNATLVPLSNLPELRYFNVAGEANPLADRAEDRDNLQPLTVNLYAAIAD